MQRVFNQSQKPFIVMIQQSNRDYRYYTRNWNTEGKKRVQRGSLRRVWMCCLGFSCNFVRMKGNSIVPFDSILAESFISRWTIITGKNIIFMINSHYPIKTPSWAQFGTTIWTHNFLDKNIGVAITFFWIFLCCFLIAALACLGSLSGSALLHP